MKRKLTGGGAWCESGRRPATAAGGRRAEGGREGVKLISDRDRGPTEIIVVVRFSWKKKKLLSGQAQGDGRPSGVAGGARRHAVTWLPTLPTRGWPGRGGYRTFHLPGLAQEPAPAPAVPRLSPARPAASPPGSINCSDAQFSVQHLCTLPLDSLGQKFILTTMLLL
ncbi:hypothetical protein PVAP13_9NG136500 [Panicum virgatum]|uniref:Uncharacterized protein n=1 Tax=Panicum virgatum TaxID=38727 RepID=A0A8T0MEI6_PANVG|nr:hypothetical protein PVAP13_9NG136500 [Panicum virgatum]